MRNEEKYKVAIYMRFSNEAQFAKTALYCRTATKDDCAIQKQEELLRLFALDNNYLNLCCNNDNGEKGITLERPAISQLISDIKSGEVGTVLTTNLDRIARGIKLLSEWELILKNAGVRCVTMDMVECDLPDWYNLCSNSYNRA